jgi:hypothetical protein
MDLCVNIATRTPKSISAFNGKRLQEAHSRQMYQIVHILAQVLAISFSFWLYACDKPNMDHRQHGNKPSISMNQIYIRHPVLSKSRGD